MERCTSSHQKSSWPSSEEEGFFMTREKKGMGLFHRHDWTPWQEDSTEKLAQIVGVPPQRVEWRMCNSCGASEIREAK
jgi:hypothetical protein